MENFNGTFDAQPNTFLFQPSVTFSEAGFAVYVGSNVLSSLQSNGMAYKYTQFLTPYGGVIGIALKIPDACSQDWYTSGLCSVSDPQGHHFLHLLKNQCTIPATIFSLAHNESHIMTLGHPHNLRQALARYVNECNDHNSSLHGADDFQKSLNYIHKNYFQGSA